MSNIINCLLNSKNYFITQIQIDSLIPSAFCAMATALIALMRFPNELPLNVLALALDWFKDTLKYCVNQSYSKEIKEKIRREFDNIIISLIVTASKSNSKHNIIYHLFFNLT